MFKFMRPAIVIASLLGIFSSCKKADTTPAVTPPTAVTPTPAAVSDLVKDSALLNTRDLYLWYSQIPATFKAHDYADPGKLMDAIHPYSIESGFTAPVDRWSFGMLKKDWDNLSGGIASSTASTTSDGDFGISVFFKADGDLRVRSAERLSSAGMLGVERSWRVTKINGSTDITISNAQYIIDNVYKSKSSTFTFIKPDGTSVDLTLTASHYKTQPVYMDSVYNINNKKIGYLVFSSFIGDTAQIASDLNRVFTKFSNNSVSDVVIDLRYNGGGYVSISQLMANYLAPQSANGSLMMKEMYNDKNSQYNLSTNFHKIGGLNLSRIYFIVTTGTASASELLINNLKPFMDVKLVGPTTTHGKPVGFFPVPVGDWYVFPVSFRSVNNAGSGNYFSGIPVTNSVADGLDKNWGDVLESSLSSALKHITTGAFTREGTFNQDPRVTRGNEILNEPSFMGMVSKRK